MSTDEIMVRLGLDSSSLNRGLNDAKNQVKDFAHDMQHEISGAVGGMFGFGALMEGGKSILEFGKQISRMSEATGLSAEEFQRLAFTIGKVGGDSDMAERALQRFAQAMGQAKEGNKEYINIFERWGVSFSGDVSDGIESVTQRMSEMVDPTEKAAMATDLFGRGSAKMVAALEDWKNLHGEGASFITDDELENIKKFNEELDKLIIMAKVIGAKLFSGEIGGLLGNMYTFFGRVQAISEDKEGAWHPIAAWKKQNTDADMVEKLKQASKYQRALAHKREIEKQAKEEMAKILEKDRVDQQNFTEKQQREHDLELKQEQEMQERIDRKKKEAAKEIIAKELSAERFKNAETRNEAMRNAPYFHTVAELAGDAVWRPGQAGTSWFGGWDGSPAAMQAKWVEEAQSNLTQWTRYHGTGLNKSEHEAYENELVRIKNLKAPLEQLGFINPEDRLKKSDEVIAILLHKLNGDGGGIPVTATNG